MKKKIDAFDDASIKVPFIIPEITKNDKNAVLNALNSSLLTDLIVANLPFNFQKTTRPSYS